MAHRQPDRTGKDPLRSSSTDTVFYLMYGNSAITTDQSDPPNTWDSNFKGVWHMGDNAANTIIKESTVTGANGTNNANTSSKTATGQIGQALSYNGSTDGSFAAINLSATNIATLSFWMKWTTNANDDDLAFEYTPNYNANAGGFIADWNSSSYGGGKFEAGAGKGNFTYWTDLFVRPSTATWHLVHLVYNRSGPTNKVYVDGSLQTLTTGTRSGSGLGNFANSSLYFMSRAASALNAAGTLDEVRLSTIERNPNWVTTEYNNQSSPGTFITIGSESCPSGTPTPTPTPTATPIVTPTSTPPPPTPTPTAPPPTPTPTATATPTATPTPTPTPATACQRSITIDHTKVPSTQSNFTVLVSLTDPALKTVANGGHVANANGYDIGFYADSGGTTKLKWEVEKYDGTTGNLIAWVKIPSVSSSTDTVFYLMYGNSAITTDQSDPPNTWDSNFKAVWHLRNDTILSLIDSISGNSLTNTGTVGATTGIIDGAAGTFNGTSQSLNSPPIDLTTTGHVMLTAWVNTAAFANDDGLFFEFSNNFNLNPGGFLVDPNDTPTRGFVVGLLNDAGHNEGYFTRPFTGWHYYAFTFDFTAQAGTLATGAYVDAIAQVLTQNKFITGSPGFHAGYCPFYIMSRGATTLFHQGAVDEVRLSSIFRSPEWITTELNNQSSPGTFITMGSESCAN